MKNIKNFKNMDPNVEEMHICFSIDNRYTQHVYVTMNSILKNNKNKKILFYIVSNHLSEKNKKSIEKLKKTYTNVDITYFLVSTERFDDLKLNIPYITQQTYYRYIIPELLPNLKKALYLDSDIVVNGSLEELWNTDIEDYFVAGVRDTYIKDINYSKNLGYASEDLYINAGVLLLNLKKIRDENKIKELFDNTVKYSKTIKYQDQDIINLTFKGKIKEISQKYNYTFKDVIVNKKEVLEKAVIIHFTGDKKPWDHIYSSGNPAEFLYFKYLKGTPFYNKFLLLSGLKRLKKFFFYKEKYADMRKINLLGYGFTYYKKKKNTIKVALLVDEFFGAANTAYGGYGFLARHYIAKYIPCEKIHLDLLLGFSRKLEKLKVDDIFVYKLPKKKKEAKRWLKKQKYDVFLSIELTSSSFRILSLNKERRPLVLWVQDPRPWYEWREINTVKLFPETCYWDTPVYEYVNFMNWKRKVRFITQGHFLEEKAKDLYRLNDDTYMEYLPNPIKFDKSFNVQTYPKKNHIIFLGRIESVKRGWLFCEIAKKLPEYEFYVIGQSFRETDKNENIMKDYKRIQNLHFVGHLEGKAKEKYLKEAKILVNTSIHEALPISFLEALSYGTLLVSNRNPENLTSKFGIYVGKVLGDGFDKVDLFSKAIKEIIDDDLKRRKTSLEAVQYIQKVHNINNFITNLRRILWEEGNK